MSAGIGHEGDTSPDEKKDEILAVRQMRFCRDVMIEYP